MGMLHPSGICKGHGGGGGKEAVSHVHGKDKNFVSQWYLLSDGWGGGSKEQNNVSLVYRMGQS